MTPSFDAQLAIVQVCASVPNIFQANRLSPSSQITTIGILNTRLNRGERVPQQWIMEVSRRTIRLSKDAASTYIRWLVSREAFFVNVPYNQERPWQLETIVLQLVAEVE